MTHKWILDVLTDLKEFAQDNDLPVLAGQLEDTTVIALAEMTSTSQPSLRPQREYVNGKLVRPLFTNLGGRAGSC